ncbi:hypothetical protein WJ978_29305 [Achromobacter xylosoxidans]
MRHHSYRGQRLQALALALGMAVGLPVATRVAAEPATGGAGQGRRNPASPPRRPRPCRPTPRPGRPRATLRAAAHHTEGRAGRWRHPTHAGAGHGQGVHGQPGA